MPIGKNNKMQQHLNYRVKITLQDSRTFIGTFKAFDKCMNVIIGDCEEFRTMKTKGPENTDKEERRMLGFVLLRGEYIVSLSVVGPPIQEEGLRVPGIARAARRCIPAGGGGVPAGLQGPVRGVGGPLQQVMIPGSRGMGMVGPPQVRGGPGMPLMMPPPGMLAMQPGMQGMPMGHGSPPPMQGLPPGIMRGAMQPGMQGMPMGRGGPPPMQGPPPGMMWGGLQGQVMTPGSRGMGMVGPPQVRGGPGMPDMMPPPGMLEMQPGMQGMPMGHGCPPPMQVLPPGIMRGGPPPRPY